MLMHGHLSIRKNRDCGTQKSPFSTLLIVHEFKNKFHGEIQIIRSQKPQGDFIQQINHKKEIT